MIHLANYPSNKSLLFGRYQMRLLAYFTAQYLGVAVWNRNRIVQYIKYPHTEQGMQKFATWVAEFIDIPLDIIVDTADEEYRVEAIPHVFSNRQELVLRKLDKLYRGTQYRIAQFIRTENISRKEGIYLCSALYPMGPLQGWMTHFQTLHIKFAGVYLLPVISSILLKHSKLNQYEHTLLLEKLPSGLRQSYFYRGHLYMSRLVASVSDDNPSATYQRETENMRLYLINKHYLGHETALTLLVIGKNLQPFEFNLLNTTTTYVDSYARYANKGNAIGAIGIEEQPEFIYLGALNNHYATLPNLATRELTLNYRLSKMRQWLIGGTIIANFVFLLLLGWLIILYEERQITLDEAKHDVALQQHRYDAAAKTQETLLAEKSHLNAIQGLDRLLNNAPQTPQKAMYMLSEALEAFPTIRLDKLDWIFAADTTAKDSLWRVPKQNGNVVATPVPYESLFLEGSIVPFKGDYHGALVTLHKWLVYLQNNPLVSHAEIIQEPVNADSYVQLKGDTRHNQSETVPSATFKAKITLKKP